MPSLEAMSLKVVVSLNPEDTMIQKQMIETLKKLDEAMDADLNANAACQLESSMKRARDNGKTQWWNPALCKIEMLKENLAMAVATENWTAARNYSAMLEYRQSTGI